MKAAKQTGERGRQRLSPEPSVRAPGPELLIERGEFLDQVSDDSLSIGLDSQSGDDPCGQAGWGCGHD
jgi:hypothetical protein